MSTLTGSVHATSKLRRALGIGGVGLSMLVAAGVAALFLALPGSNRTSSVPRQQSSGYAPLIQHRGEELDKRATSQTQHTSQKGQTDNEKTHNQRSHPKRRRHETGH